MRTRLILSYALVLLVSIATFVIILRQSATREVKTFMVRGGMADLDDLVQRLESYYQANGSWDGAETLLGMQGSGMGRGGQGGMGPGMMAAVGYQRLRLADDSGRVLYDSAGTAAGSQLTRLERTNAVALRGGLRVTGYLLAESDTTLEAGAQANLVSRLTRAGLLAALIGGGLSLLLALALSYQLLRPVQDLTRASQKLARGNLSERVPVHGGGELADLGHTFNQMAESLEHAEQIRRDLMADIAHELRTPLAVQRANLEAIQDGVYDTSPETIQSILDQNRMLTRLVEDLRTLALADAGKLTLNRYPADFAGLIARLVDGFQPQADSQQVRLNLHLPAQPLPLISIDPLRIEQVVSNLLSNALRHTPPQGQINVEVVHEPNQVRLSVHDSGPGIPADALPHIFERFYRADASRSREAGGSGLGLSIARQLAQAHQGSLDARNHPDGGAEFVLVLPTRTQPENG